MKKTIILSAVLYTSLTTAAMADMKLGHMNCLAENIFHEARGESEKGWMLVMDVVKNRIADPRWGDNACEVVYEPYQFSWTHQLSRDEQSRRIHAEKKTWMKIVKFVKNNANKKPTSKANHYATRPTFKSWMVSMVNLGTVGSHKFFKG